MYKATKQWQPNWYMEQLMGDSILYFLAYVSVSTSLISICNCHCVLLPSSRLFEDELTTRMLSSELLGTLFSMLLI